MVHTFNLLHDARGACVPFASNLYQSDLLRRVPSEKVRLSMTNPVLVVHKWHELLTAAARLVSSLETASSCIAEN